METMQRIALVSVVLLLSATGETAPPPGHPGAEQAGSMLAVPNQPPALRGKVLEALDSNDYTYLRVTHDTDGERWLAAPRIPLTVGTMVRYGEGTRMVNFFSKIWNRTFPVVYFIGQVQPE